MLTLKLLLNLQIVGLITTIGSSYWLLKLGMWGLIACLVGIVFFGVGGSLANNSLKQLEKTV
jgi:hypothetical protein